MEIPLLGSDIQVLALGLKHFKQLVSGCLLRFKRLFQNPHLVLLLKAFGLRPLQLGYVG